MADVPTANLGLTKPEVGASRATWGVKTNANWDGVDAIFAPGGTGTAVGMRIGVGKKLIVEGTIEGAGGAAGIITGAIVDKAVTYAKIQDISATDKVLGRATAGAGTVEEIPLTGAGRALIGAVDLAAQQAILGVGGAAPVSVTSSDPGAAAAPFWTLDRNSASPAVGDELGHVQFAGRDSIAAAVNYSALGSRIIDPVARDGALGLWSLVTGVATRSFEVWKGIFANTLADKGPGTINVIGLYQSGSPTALIPRGHIDGLIMTNATDVANDITVGAGETTASQADYLLRLAAPITKRLDAAWAVGDAQGGLDTGTKAGDTWYHVYLIARIDTGVVDVLFSTGATTPTAMPTGYTKSRRIGAVFNAAGTGIAPFEQLADWFEWVTPFIDIDDSSPGTTAKTRTLTVPLGVRTMADITPFQRSGTNTPTTITSVSSLQTVDQAVQSAAAGGLNFPGTVGGGIVDRWSVGGRMFVRTNLSSRIRTRADDATTKTGIITNGYIDFRGRNA